MTRIAISTRLLSLFLLTAVCGLASAQVFSPYDHTGASAVGSGDRQVLTVDETVGLPTGEAAERGFALSVPTPEGETLTLDLVGASVFPANLRARYPDIRTYRGYARGEGRVAAVIETSAGRRVFVGDGTASEAFQIAANGAGEALLGPVEETLPVGVRPALSCGFVPGEHDGTAEHDVSPPAKQRDKVSAAVEKRRYIMALACTGEFAERYGGTKASVNAAYAEALNILNALLIAETAVEFQLHPDNDTVIFLNPGTDPYRNASLGSSLLGANSDAINALIDPSTYDIGHVFTNGCSDVGGVVAGSVCDDRGKSRGVTCHYAGIPFIVRNVMAHEVAHQFRVSHSWNNCPGSDQQRAGSGAFEPGSGSTIMSYQGACGAANNIGGFGEYYHVGSLQQFRDFYVAGLGSVCSDVIPVDNQVPVVTADGIDGLTIPARTPFVLEGAATDADGDALVYNWEQYDLGPALTLCEQREEGPLFRSVRPSADGNVRYFPEYQTILSGRRSCEEQLPRFSRDLTFRLTARDLDPVGGGTDWAQVSMRVDGDAGPFRLTSQASGGTVYAAGQFIDVTWDVAGTNAGAIGISAVDILLSTDGGRTFPTVLVEGTSNDGSEGITLPADLETDVARLMIRPVGNIFFAVSEASFSVVIPTEPGFTFAPSASTTFLCLPEDAVEIDLVTGSLLGFDNAIDIAIEADLPTGITASLDRTSVMPGERARLTLDLSAFRETDSVTVDVVATADGAEAARRTLLFDLVSTDFSDLELMGPDNGETGVAPVPTFAYAPSTRADKFVLELSTDPNFGFEKSVIEDPDPAGETFDFLLESNTVYFWRVVPRNRCIESYDVPVNAFATFATDCRLFENDQAIDIPANSTRDVVIPVQVDESGPVTEINVPLVDIGFGDVSQLTVSLRSPSGTTARLYRRRCAGSIYRAGFDDDAPLGNTYCGSPGDGVTRQPRDPLSVFIGEEINGEWQLIVEIASANAAGGQFRNFQLEFCADLVSAAPTLEIATVPVPTGGFQYLSEEFLRADDPDNEVPSLTYVIVEEPTRGHLERSGVRLQTGSRFVQGSVFNSEVTYVDDAGVEGSDSMRIVLTDNAGNLIATPTVTFDIRDDAVTGVEEFGQVAMTLAPNPTGEASQLRFATPSLGGEVLVFDAQGRSVERRAVAPGATAHEVDAGAYAPGIYLVTYRGAEGTRTLRLVRQ